MKQVKHSSQRSLKEERIIKEGINRLLRFHSGFESRIKHRISLLQAGWIKYLQQEKKLKDSEEVYHAIFNQAAVGMANVDVKGKFLRVNRKFCSITGRTQKELLTKTIFDITYEEDIASDRAYLKSLGKVGKGKTISSVSEKRFVKKNGALQWVRVTRSLVQGTTGKQKFITTIVEDINEEKQIRNALQILADAGGKLAGSLDYKKTINSITDIIVPHLADWCILDILQDDKKFHRIKIAYADGESEYLAEVLYQYPPIGGSKRLVEKVISRGKSILVPRYNLKDAAKYAQDKMHLQTILHLKAKSVMVVPLNARGKVFGAISFYSTKEHRFYTSVDLVLAEQIVSRAALALDNAGLYKKASEAVEVRDEFLTIASHELKTPLTSIKGFVQIVAKRIEPTMDGDSYSLIMKVNAQVDRLTRLIADLLDVSHISAEKFVLEKEPIDLNILISDVVSVCQQLTTKHKIVVTGTFTQKIIGDSHRLMQVISNILTNAIKYSPDSDKINIKLSQTSKEAIVKVQDFGFGIAKELQAHVFDRYYRIEVFQKRKIGGLGLGLYIASEIVKKHGGRIWIESTPNQGSSFYIALPFNPEEVHT